MTPPLCHKKALIIGLNYTNMGLWTLKGAHNDARSVRRLLQDTYRFAEHEMVVMSDSEGVEYSLLPTRQNIIHQLDTFVIEKNEDTDYVFIYAGHTDQFPDTGPAVHQEEDGKAECIVPLDAISSNIGIPDKSKVIFDFELHEYIIKRLGPGCRLTAIADSCHSATLLNLPHYRCNCPIRNPASLDGARYVLRRLFCNPLEVTVTKVPRGGRRSESPDDAALPDTTGYAFRKRVPLGGLAQEQSQGICTGLCCRLPTEVDGHKRPAVVYISSCKDGETAYEDRDGKSMLQCIISFLKDKHAPTLEEIMLHVQSNAEETFEMVRAHQMRHDDSITGFHLFQRGNDNTRAKRWQPQLSSTQPLDLKSNLILCQMPSRPPVASSRTCRASPRL